MKRMFSAGSCFPLAVLGVLVCVAVMLAPAAPALGQTEAEDAAEAAEDPVAEAPPVEQDVAGADDSVEEISYLSWAINSLGWAFGLIFLALSFTLFALLVMNILMARRENVVPGQLVESFEQHLSAKQYQEAYDLAKGDESFLAQVLSAGLAKISAGHAEAVEAMQEVGEEESMRMEHRLSYLALIGTLSPMIGLLGTVSGMISSFRLIANTASGAPDAQQLAQGISTALFTTFIGLALAIPALAAYNLLRNRVMRLVLEAGIISEGLMGRFQKK